MAPRPIADDFPLKQELETFEARKAGLLETDAGRYVLIRGDEVAGVWDTQADAIREGYQRFGHVAFLAKKIEAVEVPLFMPIAI